MQLAYTIGATQIYDICLRHNKQTHKLSKEKDYNGAYVWKTVKEAKRFLNSEEFLKINWGNGRSREPKDFSVYQIKLPNCWDEDVFSENGINYLLSDAIITSKMK